MYEYLYTKLKTIFPELINGTKVDIYPTHAPDDVISNGIDVIVYTVIGVNQTYHSKMSTIQIDCYSKSALRSVEMCNRVRKTFKDQTRLTGQVLKTTIAGGVDMLYDTDSKYYQSNCEVLVQSTLEFV